MADDLTDDDDDDDVEDDERRGGGGLAGLWKRVGGGSFTVSLIVHGLLVLVAGSIIWQQATKKEEEVSFLSGGGGGQGERTRKMRPMQLKSPTVKLSAATGGSISLPDTSSTLADMGSMTLTNTMSGTPGSGGGWGGGSGGGNGLGIGKGMGPGKGIGFTASFLGIKAVGNNFIFCIDTSGSMRTNLQAGGIETLRKELKKVISELPSTVNFNIICFGQMGDLFKDNSVAATPEHKAEAVLFLGGYYGGSGAAGGDFGRTRTEKFGTKGVDAAGVKYTPLKPDDVKELAGTEGSSRIDLAMVAAFERKPSTLFVLSDGAPGTKKKGEEGTMKPDDLIDLVHEKYVKILQNAPLEVLTITIDGGDAGAVEGNRFMTQLSRKFKGKHKEIKAKNL